MCKKCVIIDRDIAHYRDLSSRITDAQTLQGIALLISKLKAEKQRLHPATELLS